MVKLGREHSRKSKARRRPEVASSPPFLVPGLFPADGGKRLNEGLIDGGQVDIDKAAAVSANHPVLIDTED